LAGFFVCGMMSRLLRAFNRKWNENAKKKITSSLY